MSAVLRCECGYQTAPRMSERRAAYAMRQHSCARWSGLAASRARGTASRAAIDRTPVACPHPAGHQHGTYAAYKLDACRCKPCSKTAVDYDRTRIRQTAYGRWQPYVDAHPARQHVRALQAAGIGLKRIADLAGISHGSLAKLMYGERQRNLAPSKRLRPATATALLAVQPDPAACAPGTRIPARPTWRRIEGLVALGYPKAWIAEQLGRARCIQFGSDEVLASTAADVVRLAARIGDSPGPSDRARRYAAARGWLVPGYGTDDDIARLDDARRELADHERTERLQRRQRAQQLHAAGVQSRDIAAALGTTVDVVQADLRRPLEPRAYHRTYERAS